MSFLSRFTAPVALALMMGNVHAGPEDEDVESEEMESIQVTATRTGNLVRDEPIAEFA